MLTSYLKTAYRLLLRNKGYTFINVGGLAVSIACCILIGCWVQHELSYDAFHQQSDRIYRVVQDADEGGKPEADVGGAMGPTLQRDFSEVQTYVRLFRTDLLLGASTDPTSQDKLIEEPNFTFADSTFFRVFDGFTLAQGDPASALATPGTVVLSHEAAIKYFGTPQAVGKTLNMPESVYGEDQARLLTVTGVMDPIPTNSHLRPNALSSMTTLKQLIGQPTQQAFDSFKWPDTYTYVLLSESANAEQVAAELPAFIKRHRAPAIAEKTIPHIQALTDVHLHSDYTNDLHEGVDIAYVYLFSALALFILLIACINFINILTARSAPRAKEVGVRKAIGADRRQLVGQFLGESLLLAFISTVLGVVLAQVLLPVFNTVAGRSLSIGYTSNPLFWLGLLAAVFAIGILAGSYPAFVLSGFSPVRALRGSAPVQSFKRGLGLGRTRGSGLRHGLVIFQFAISIILVASTLVAYQQFSYMRNADTGFATEQIVILPSGEDYELLKAELASQASVQSVAGAAIRPGFGSGAGNPQYETAPFSNDPNALMDEPSIPYQEVDYGFFETMELEIVAGRAFSKEYSDWGHDVPGDSLTYSNDGPTRGRSIVINESAAEQMGWNAQEAVGQKLRFFAVNQGRFFWDIGGTIIGVVEDYHATPLHERIPPIAYTLGGDNYVLVKASGGSPTQIAETLAAVWDRINPQIPVDISFLDQDLEAQYLAEKRLSRIIGLFALVALTIACLGLFGLATHAAEQRTKEIGVRKALGATSFSIVSLVSKSFLKLIGIAFVLAIPIVYIAMKRWLQDFAYHVAITPWVLLGAGILALLVGLASVSYQAFRAAHVDPVNALQHQ